RPSAKRRRRCVRIDGRPENFHTVDILVSWSLHLGIRIPRASQAEGFATCSELSACMSRPNCECFRPRPPEAQMRRLSRSRKTGLMILAIGSIALLMQRNTAGIGALPALIATATLDRATDFAGLTDTLENGLSQSILGGIGSGLTWAGGTTFLAVPDRGPNATPYTNGAAIDNTSSFIARFETVDLSLTPSAPASV